MLLCTLYVGVGVSDFTCQNVLLPNQQKLLGFTDLLVRINHTNIYLCHANI